MKNDRLNRDVFPENPQVEFLIDRDLERGRMRAKLTRPFAARLLDGRMLVVPQGYIFDGASKPWFTYSFGGGPYDKPYLAAAIPHDFLCDLNRENWWERLDHVALSKDVAEDLAMQRAEFKFAPDAVHDNFKYHCRSAGTNAFRREYMTLAVRLVCRTNWREI